MYAIVTVHRNIQSVTLHHHILEFNMIKPLLKEQSHSSCDACHFLYVHSIHGNRESVDPLTSFYHSTAILRLTYV